MKRAVTYVLDGADPVFDIGFEQLNCIVGEVRLGCSTLFLATMTTKIGVLEQEIIANHVRLCVGEKEFHEQKNTSYFYLAWTNMNKVNREVFQESLVIPPEPGSVVWITKLLSTHGPLFDFKLEAGNVDMDRDAYSLNQLKENLILKWFCKNGSSVNLW
ncbi:hypothetical protein LIER_20963 [Lithospermum erythrorhizon]|uniref:Uncharacterized protein n=1 Tax=Lithospermum erythrorhizon TaxID=34254 RepID=A0AAV3QNF1_LITER